MSAKFSAVPSYVLRLSFMLSCHSKNLVKNYKYYTADIKSCNYLEFISYGKNSIVSS